MRDAFQHPNIDNVATDYASSICDDANAMSAYSVWGPGYRDSTGKTPVPGDLVVFSGKPGHAAVIAGLSAPTRITVVQQNGWPMVAEIDWSPDKSFFGAPTAECWVHAEPAQPAAPPSGPPCGCFAPGPACGLAVVDHAWWYGCSAAEPEAGIDYQALYDCDGGVFTERQQCSQQCVTVDIFDAGGACGP
jgi:hypothetical protein